MAGSMVGRLIQKRDWQLASDLESKFRRFDRSWRILALGLITLAGFSLASGGIIAQERTSKVSADRLGEMIKELTKASQPAQRVHAAALLG